MTKFFYDCEFLEDGSTIAPLSIGIVSEHGDEYYAVFADAPWKRVKDHDWLMKNVVPHLPKVYGDARNAQPRSWLFNMADPCVKPRTLIAEEVRHFLVGRNEPVQLWGYYSDYDHVLLAQLYGPMAAMPKGLPWRTNDIAMLHDLAGPGVMLPAQDAALAHSAIHDARWIKEAYGYLERWHAVGPLHPYRPQAGSAIAPGALRLPEHLRGDGPCMDCGTEDTIIWFTDNVYWNNVMSWPGEYQHGDPGGLLCIPCFVIRADRAGLDPAGYRLLPEWRWETHYFDDSSVINPITGKPYEPYTGPGDPVEPPDPRCICGALWGEGDICARNDKFLYPDGPGRNPLRTRR